MQLLCKIFILFVLCASQAFANVDINNATASELRQFPGVGKAIAKRIMDYRAANGVFSSCDDLIKVKGIGPKTMLKIKPLCHTGDGAVAKVNPVITKPSGNRFDFNTATAAELVQVKGIGKKMASRIIKDREANGAFTSCDDLIRIKGIGAKTLSKFKPYCKVAAK